MEFFLPYPGVSKVAKYEKQTAGYTRRFGKILLLQA